MTCTHAWDTWRIQRKGTDNVEKSTQMGGSGQKIKCVICIIYGKNKRVYDNYNISWHRNDSKILRGRRPSRIFVSVLPCEIAGLPVSSMCSFLPFGMLAFYMLNYPLKCAAARTAGEHFSQYYNEENRAVCQRYFTYFHKINISVPCSLIWLQSKLFEACGL